MNMMQEYYNSAGEREKEELMMALNEMQVRPNRHLLVHPQKAHVDKCMHNPMRFFLGQGHTAPV